MKKHVPTAVLSAAYLADIYGLSLLPENAPFATAATFIAILLLGGMGFQSRGAVVPVVVMLLGQVILVDAERAELTAVALTGAIFITAVIAVPAAVAGRAYDERLRLAARVAEEEVLVKLLHDSAHEGRDAWLAVSFFLDELPESDEVDEIREIANAAIARVNLSIKKIEANEKRL